MSTWQLRGEPEARRMVPLRAFGEEAFTWAHLLANVLAAARVCVLFFPSRFGLPADETCMEQLRTFGANTSLRTSVNFWDPRDEQFEKALQLFGLSRPPAVVLTGGGEVTEAAQAADDPGLYSIAFTEPDLFTDRQRFADAVGVAHQLLMTGDSRQIADYIRRRNLRGLLEAIGRIAAQVRDQLVALKPTLGLPGGVSIKLG